MIMKLSAQEGDVYVTTKIIFLCILNACTVSCMYHGGDYPNKACQQRRDLLEMYAHIANDKINPLQLSVFQCKIFIFDWLIPLKCKTDQQQEYFL